MGEGKEQKTGRAKTLVVVAVTVRNTPPNDLANIAVYHSVWESPV